MRIKRYTDDLDSAASLIVAMALLVEARDGNTKGHCHRMANYATALGRALSLSEEDLQALHRGGFLHDIGMLAIPDDVLRKTGPLDAGQFELMKSHTTVGDALCANLRSLESVRPIACIIMSATMGPVILTLSAATTFRSSRRSSGSSTSTTQ